jgi:hypothetical protein
MTIYTTCGALILAGLLAGTASPTLSLAQTTDKAAAAAKDAGAAASKSATKRATANARATPTKHRYWRHRGGQHPHYGSRRVRSQVHTSQ